MKKLIFSCLLIFTGILIFESFTTLKKRKEGAPAGHSGSPGDSLKNCTVCHGGDAVVELNWVTSDIPADGYIPGAKYKIRAVNKEGTATRFGFQVSPQNINGDLLGTLVVTDAVKTQLVGSNKYITYTENGVAGIDSLDWFFDWIAPAAGTGNVTFYGAFNSNADNHKENDKTFLSKLIVKENLNVGVLNTSINPINLSVYPNPAINNLTLNFNITNKSDVLIDIYNLSGKQITTMFEPNVLGHYAKNIDILEFKSGIYFIKVSVNNISTFKKVLINN